MYYLNIIYSISREEIHSSSSCQSSHSHNEQGTFCRCRYMTDETLRAGILKGTFLTMYQVQGTDGYFGNWSQVCACGRARVCGWCLLNMFSLT